MNSTETEFKRKLDIHANRRNGTYSFSTNQEQLDSLRTH